MRFEAVAHGRGNASTGPAGLTIRFAAGSLQSASMPPSKIGKYTIVGALGGRGEGLYLGEYGGRRVAIRLPSAPDAAERERIAGEARKVAGLSHPNIALQEVGLHEGQLFLVSDLSGGKSLDAWLREQHSLTDQLRVADGLASGLAHAHEQGVLHRALKPGNILVGSAGECRLTSFGLGSSANALGDAAATYAAPEVIEGMPDTAQSDIYSAGVILYEMLSGSGAGVSDGPVARPLRDLRPELSKDLADAIMACRERSPDWRPKDLSYLIEVLHRSRGPAGAPAAKAAPVARPGRPVTRAPQPARHPTFTTRSSARSPIPILVGIVLVALVVAGAWFWTRSPEAAVPAAAARPVVTTPTPPPSTLAAASPSPTPAAALRPSPREPEAAKPSPVANDARPSPIAVAAASAAQTPAPAPSHEAPRAAATPTPLATPVPAPSPTPTTVPATTLIAEAPPKADAAAPVPAPAGPAALTAVSPPVLKRGTRTLVDIRGTGLRVDMQAMLSKGRAAADGLSVVGRRYVNSTLIEVFLVIEPGAPAGTYTLALGDGEGTTNSVRFEVK
jgi:eukaryotic-like serine/threonine-protein kinase